MECRNSAAKWGKNGLTWYFCKCSWSFLCLQWSCKGYVRILYSPQPFRSYSTTTSLGICPVKTLAAFDSTTTSNCFEVFGVGETIVISPNVRNKDGESIVFVYNEVARDTYGSCAHLNLPYSYWATASSHICLMATSVGFDSKTTSNHYEVFTTKDIMHVSPNVKN